MFIRSEHGLTYFMTNANELIYIGKSLRLPCGSKVMSILLTANERTDIQIHTLIIVHHCVSCNYVFGIFSYPL